MKRKIRNLVIVFALVCILTSQAFAITFYYRASSGYDLIWSDDYVYAQIFDLLFTQEFTSICNVSPYESSYTYKVVVSYDELASLVTTANTHQLNTSLYRNDAAGYWVAKVHDFDSNPWFTNDNTPRVLGNPNGYVYVAEIDTSGEDMVSLLDSILVHLTLVESYVKSAYFELWEQGGVLDDIYDVIDSIDSYVYDIKDRLYYNGKSAAYYLYKIESHLSTIANGSGSSGSSSSTDLTGVLELLDDVAQWTFDTKEYLFSISEKLDSSNSFLYELTFDMESVLSNQDYASSLLSWISSDIEDIVEDSEYITGRIDAILGACETVISNQSAALSVLETVNQSLTSVTNRLLYDGGSLAYWAYRINHFLRNDFATKLDAVLALLQEEGAFTTDISGVLADLGTLISNEEELLALLQPENGFNVDLSAFTSFYAIQSNAIKSALSPLKNISEYLRDIYWGLGLAGTDELYTGIPAMMDLQVEMIELQTNISDALSADGYIGDELHDMALDTKQIYIKLGAFQEQQNTLVDTISKSLKYNNYSVAYYVWALGGLVERSFESVLANQSTALPVLQSMSESLTTISNRLYYVDASVSYYVYAINKKLADNFPTLIANQKASLENQQKLIDLIEDLELTTNVTIENIENITIDVTNKAYEVFYITDSEGNEQNLADFSGDVLTISGRLLNFFFKVAFDDALDSVDSALDDMTEFYIDDSVLVGGGSLWE